MPTRSLPDVLRALYRSLRTAAMNKAYYGARLEAVRRKNFWLEVAIAVGTSGAIASWAIWGSTTGESIWVVVAGVATLLAVVKPFLKFPDKIERYSKLFAGHADATYDLERIAEVALIEHDVSDELYTRYRDVLDRVGDLAGDDDPNPDKDLLRRCQGEVKQQYPTSSFWMPSTTPAHV